MPSSRPSVAEVRAVTQPAGVMERRSDEHWAGRLYMRRLTLQVIELALRQLDADRPTATRARPSRKSWA
jgi:hypothetical protein